MNAKPSPHWFLPSILAILIASVALPSQAADVKVSKASGLVDNLSVETVGAIRYSNFGGPTYGAGVDAGLKFNKYVTGHARLLAYETDDWRGPAVDEASLYAEAVLLRSASGVFKLSGTGGAHHDFNVGDWGFGVGLRPSATVIKDRLDLFAGAEVRAWFNQPKDLLLTAGLSLKF